MEAYDNYQKKAGTIANELNDITFNNSAFCKAMAREHKTLQQSFTRLCLSWLRHCASVDYAECTDERNVASHTVSKKTMQACETAGVEFLLPYV